MTDTPILDAGLAPSPEAQANRIGVGAPAPTAPVSPPPSPDEAVSPPETPSPSGDSIDAVGEIPANPWESDDNPYKHVSVQQHRELAELRQAQLVESFRQEAISLKESGLDDAQIAQHLNLRAREIQVQQMHEQAQSAARIEVARRLAQQMTKAGVAISQDELLKDSLGRDIEEPAAMTARAQTLFEERRKAALSKRQATGVDKVGGEGPRAADTSTDFKKMTPLQKISFGLRKEREG